MISHEHKCIFIHIPRTGGSSIEKFFTNKSCFNQNGSPEELDLYFGYSGPEIKHIIASTAKKLYADYWDDYFKFSFVRNPWDRMVSMAKYPEFYGCTINTEFINISEYLKKFPNIEIDERSLSANYVGKSLSNAVYLNLLDEPLDFVGTFENLKQDIEFICDKIKLTPFIEFPHKNKSNHKHYTEYYDDETREIVAEKYARDIEYFGYEFGG